MAAASFNVQTLRQEIRQQMPDPYCAHLDCERLLAHATGERPAVLLTEPNMMLSAATKKRLDALVARRRTGEPLAYILGEVGFMDITLETTPAVLIPRPETEVMVQVLLGLTLHGHIKMLDAGAGTGAIALATATHRPAWHILATDLNYQALLVAKRNARRLGIALSFACGNWLAPCAAMQFDVIAANPPYIPKDHPQLQQRPGRRRPALQFEPVEALQAGTDGLIHLTTIIATAGACLKPQGWLLLEHGHDQKKAVTSALVKAGFVNVRCYLDLQQQDRVCIGQWPAPETKLSA